MKVLSNIKKQCNVSGGYSEFLKLAIPLIISISISAVQTFTDRIFLSCYSQEAYAASIPAGSTNFTVMSIFMFTIAYIDVFVAQYYGKKEYRSIGPAIWQSVYLAVISSLIIFGLSFFTQYLFESVGHPKLIIIEEIKYFKILCYGAFPAISTMALSGFYAGRSKTKIVLLVNIFGVISNIFLDFCLIFGKFGFPEMGITGAAIATNISLFIMLAIYLVLILSKKNDRVYNTRQFSIDFSFMKKLLQYGFPNGLTFFADTSEFSVFILIIGTLGILELTASNIAYSVYNIIIMPVVGFGLAISIIVGQYLGKNKASIAQTSVKSALHIVYAYISILIFIFLFFPNLIIYPFSVGSQTACVGQVRPVTINLLRISIIYLIFDPVYIIFSSAIKGAGDTVFVMQRLVILTIVLAIIPTYLIVVIFKLGVYMAWWITSSYVVFLAIICYFRYKSDKWKHMRVIDMDIVDG